MSMKALRSSVRVFVTFFAAAYVFGGSGVLIYYSLCTDFIDDEKLTVAKDLFLMVLPVATGVITYWFASRSTRPQNTSQQNQDDGSNGGDPD